MAKDPAFLFYHNDFLVGTTFMTFEERGAYITLLCHLADKGHISETNILKIISKPIWDAICCKFKKGEKGYFNERLQKEVIKRQAFTESRRENLHMGKHMKRHMVHHMENENENKDVNENINKDYLYLKDEKFKKTFSEYLEMRNRIRKPATRKAQELALKELHKQDIKTAILMLEQSIFNSWQGIFPLKQDFQGSKKIRGQKEINDTAAQIAQELHS